MSDVIRSLGNRTTNAQAIADCVALGYVSGRTLDCTYGLGRFWNVYRHEGLIAADLNPDKSPVGYKVDFTDMPFPDEWFNTVVFDPPYKYSGTASDVGPAALNADYGIAEYLTPDDRDQLIVDGMRECVRVLAPGGYLLVKCQDQVVSGKKRWQAKMVYLAGRGLGLRLVDELLVQSYRPQPTGRTQRHSRIDFSNLLVFGKARVVKRCDGSGFVEFGDECRWPLPHDPHDPNPQQEVNP